MTSVDAGHYRKEVKFPDDLPDTAVEESAIDDMIEEDQENGPDRDTLRLYAYIILFGCWVTFAFGLGSIFGLWQWCFEVVPHPSNVDSPVLKYLVEAFSEDTVIDHYYSYVFFLNFVIVWLWVFVSWIGMKLFRHSKGGGS